MDVTQRLAGGPATQPNTHSCTGRRFICDHSSHCNSSRRHNTNECVASVRAIQRNHQQQRGWDDVGYNFLIGGSDVRAEIYEGRGFDVVGAHAVGYNSRSVGIALIGDWTGE